VISIVVTDYLLRKRINEIFENGDKCYILLKDRGKLFKNQLEEDWYEQAYGKKRNIMKFRMTLPIPEGVKFATKLDYIAEVTYTMFPEHQKEFATLGLKPTFEVQLIEDVYTTNHFEIEIDLPFG
jgi:adenylate cyclase class IV